MPLRALIVHSGAGRYSAPKNIKGMEARRAAIQAGLKEAVEAGVSAMKRGSAVDGVEEAVRSMEDKGTFNAGRGACLTAVGTVQLDAAVMEGRGLRGAGVGLCECTYNPVTLARRIMERTDHVLIAGEDCARFAKATGVPTVKVQASSQARELFAKMLATMEKDHGRNYQMLKSIEGGGTVGAVGIDRAGTPAAAVSTGGRWLKLPGRIGDSAIIGAGIYADRRAGAACATGSGEDIIKCALCWNSVGFLKRFDADRAARASIALISRRSGRGTAGIITVDLKGRVGFAYNTEAMGRAWYDSAKGRVVVQV